MAAVRPPALAVAAAALALAAITAATAAVATRAATPTAASAHRDRPATVAAAAASTAAPAHRDRPATVAAVTGPARPLRVAPSGRREAAGLGVGRGSRCTTSGAAREPGGTVRVPLEVSRDGGGAIGFVAVCVHGEGPYEFLVDSGSSLSVVDPGLASTFGFAATGGPLTAAGIGCSVSITLVRISGWSLGPLPLETQTVAVQTLPAIARDHAFAGIIGSDVLARFGAVRIDYLRGTLGLGGPEGASPSRAVTTSGHSATPAALTVGSEVTIPATVLSDAGGTAVLAPARVGSGPIARFVVDTGSRLSLVSAGLAAASHLEPSDGHTRVTGFGCSVDLAEVHSGRWAIGRAAQPPQLLGVLPRSSRLRIAGDLGSDVFARYGALVIDYRDARVILAR
jgi:hypothetical protein